MGHCEEECEGGEENVRDRDRDRETENERDLEEWNSDRETLYFMVRMFTKRELIHLLEPCEK